MTRVLTVGVFDYFHYGHLMLLKQARQAGDHLTVAVQCDESVRKYKPNAELFYSAAQRMQLLSALSIVDEVVTYHDVDIDIPRLDFDVLALGEDQVHEGFRRACAWCEANGKRVVRMKYTAGISSTLLKERIKNDEAT